MQPTVGVKVPPIAGAVKPPKLPGKERFPWLGNKAGTPRIRGAGKAHRMSQLEQASYAPIRISQLRGL